MDDCAAELVALTDCGGDVRAFGELGEEAADKGISCSVCVNYKAIIDRSYFNELYGGLLPGDTSGDNSRLCSLCNDHDARSVLVCLLSGCDEFGDSCAIGCLKAICRGESRTFILIAEDKIGVLERVLYGLHKELDNEKGREIEAEGDVVLSGEVADGLYSLSIRIDKESCCVEVAGPADHVLNRKCIHNEG